MTPRSTIPLLRGIFLSAEWILLILALLVLIQSWWFNSSPPTKNGKSGTEFYAFQINLPSNGLDVSYRGDPSASVFLSAGQAELCVGNSEKFSGLWWLQRWHTTNEVIGLVFGIIIARLLRRMCERVKGGDAFSNASIDLLRNIGWAFLFYFVFCAIDINAFNASVAHELRDHLVTPGVSTSFFPATRGGSIWFMLGHAHLAFDLALLFQGLLALALAEIFRQGLLLREDSELTV